MHHPSDSESERTEPRREALDAAPIDYRPTGSKSYGLVLVVSSTYTVAQIKLNYSIAKQTRPVSRTPLMGATPGELKA